LQQNNENEWKTNKYVGGMKSHRGPIVHTKWMDCGVDALCWLIWVVVCLHAALQVQSSVRLSLWCSPLDRF